MPVIRDFIKWINQTDTRLWIVAVLCLFYAGFIPGGNEEQYLGLAKQFSDPSWIPGSDCFSDFAGTRVVFQYITGFFLHHFSFQQVVFWGRLINFIFLAFPLAAIIRRMKVTNLEFLFWFMIFYLPQQSFFAGEWIFGTFESKTIAYVFVLAALYFLLDERYLPAILFTAAGAYMHLLVAGWFAFYIFIYMVVRKVPVIQCFLYALFFLTIVSPLIWYLYNGLVKGQSAVVHGLNTNEIYVFFRNPNHIGFLTLTEYFVHKHLPKIIIAFIALILVFWIGRKETEGIISRMNWLALIILMQVFLSLIGASFDRHGFFLKFYPFRGNAIAMLVFQAEMLLLVKKYAWPWILKKGKNMKRITVSPERCSRWLFFMVLLFFVIKLDGRYLQWKKDMFRMNAADFVAQEIQQRLSPGDRFMILCDDIDYGIALPRLARREPWAVLRFVPTRSNDIYTWYSRLMIQDEVARNPELLLHHTELREVKALVSCNSFRQPFLKRVKQAGPYNLYIIDR